MRNKKQERILSMIDGYDSIDTLSTALMAIFAVWLLPALGSFFVALVGFGAGSDADRIVQFRDLSRTLQMAEAFLGFLTVIVFVYWAFRARENVRRLGKNSRIGVLKTVGRHIVVLVVGIGALILGALVPSAARLGIAVFIGSLLFFSLMFVAICFSLVSMLWRTSSLPTGGEDELPALGFVWVAAWTIMSWTGSAVQDGSRGAEATLSVEVASVVMAIHGLAIAVAAAAIALLIRQIAERQETRLAAIISYVDVDVAGTNGAVTTDQISDAWDASDNLVDFNR